MFLLRLRFFVVLLVMVIPTAALLAQAQTPSGSSPTTSSSSRAAQKAPTVVHADSSIDAGIVSNGVYHNKALGLACKIPAGWVLRTDEINAREEDELPVNGKSQAVSGDDSGVKPESRAALDRTADGGCPHASGCGKVLLAAFSRPPEARAEDVNSSIMIAAEPVAAYPGLKQAAQYFGPLAEVAKAQGFSVVEEPYEFVVGAKTVPRSDFQKDVGSRVMRQSTLALLARGWAVSITFIGGTEDEVDDLVEGLSFTAAGTKK